MKNSKFIGALMIAVECLFWGIGNPTSKIAMETVPVFWCNTIRFLLASLLFIIFFGKKIFASFRKMDFVPCLLIAIFNALAYLFGNVSLCFTSATIAAFLMSLSVAFTPFFSIFLLGRTSGIKTYLGILIIIFGLYFLCAGTGTFDFGIGELFALLCSMSLALSVTLTQRYAAQIDSLPLAALQTFTAAVLALMGAFIFHGRPDLSALTLPNLSIIAYLAIFCTILAFILQNASLHRVSALFASVLFCLEPVFTAGASFIILNEKLMLRSYAGGALIIIGIVVVSCIQRYESKMELKNDKIS